MQGFFLCKRLLEAQRLPFCKCKKEEKGAVFFDSAGKYGAGLALGSLGRSLNKQQVKQEGVIISNKLVWVRTALKTAEPTLEKGIWKGL